MKIQDVPDLALYKMRFYAPGRALIWAEKSQPNGAPPYSNQIYMFNGSSVQLMYSGPETLDAAAYFASIPGGIVVLEGRKILFSDGGALQTLTTVTQPEFGGQIAARSTQDIFIRMLDGIAQYNGTDVQYIFTCPNLNILAMIAFPRSIFAIGYSYTTHLNYVYRGYLPQ